MDLDRPAAVEVGRVIGTDPATPLEFWVAVAPGRFLQLDDVVALRRDLPDGQSVIMYGVVTQLRASHDGARFDSDVFLVGDGLLPGTSCFLTTRTATFLRTAMRATEHSACSRGPSECATATLPRFASAAHRDARAPQNLTPIGGLERHLRHRLGDAAVLERLLPRTSAAWRG